MTAYQIGQEVTIDIRPLKRLSGSLFTPDSTLRRVLLVEPDFMSGLEYCAKLGTWLALLTEEVKRGS